MKRRKKLKNLSKEKSESKDTKILQLDEKKQHVKTLKKKLQQLEKLVEKIWKRDFLYKEIERKLKRLESEYDKLERSIEKPLKSEKRKKLLKENKRYSKNFSGYVSIERQLFDSDAFLDLSGQSAIRILLRFYYKTFRKFIKGNKRGGSKSLVTTNDGEIQLLYRELQFNLGISRPTISACLEELIDEKGFIDITERGVGRGTDRKATKYSISFRYMDYGTDRYVKPKIPFNLEP